MLVSDRLFIPLKILYPCNTSFCWMEDKTSNGNHSQKRNVLVFPSHISLQCFHSANHQARNQERVHHTLLTHAWCVSPAVLHCPHHCGRLFGGTKLQRCPATTKPSGRAESASDIFCRKKGRSVSGPLHQV